MIRTRASRTSIKVKSKRINREKITPDDNSSKSSCKTVADVYKEFADESTIHGIKYTAHSKTIFERISWAIIIILSIAAASALALKFYEKHQMGNMRTLVVTNQYPSWRYKLPAMTFCHPSIAALHRIDDYLKNTHLRWPEGLGPADFKENLQYVREALYPAGQYQMQLNKLHSIMVLNNLTLAELFTKVSPPCSDFVVLCQFEGESTPCDTFLSHSLTPHGICCSFNYAYVNGERRWSSMKDIKSFYFGDNFILSLLIKTYDDKDRISAGVFGDGIKVFIHERYTYPGPTAQEFVANMGSEVVARLYGRLLTVSPEVRNLPFNERKCYLSLTETELYRADNCYIECRENKFRKLCGCIPFFASIINRNDTVCDLTQAACLARARVAAGTVSLWDKECNCLPDCEGTTFQVVTTTLPFNAPQFNPAEFYQKALEYPKRTAIHITYAGQSFMLLRRELVLSWINLVSSLGGVFSLFLGCSFISLFEIFYFIGSLVRKLACSRPRKIRIHN